MGFTVSGASEAALFVKLHLRAPAERLARFVGDLETRLAEVDSFYGGHGDEGGVSGRGGRVGRRVQAGRVVVEGAPSGVRGGGRVLEASVCFSPYPKRILSRLKEARFKAYKLIEESHVFRVGWGTWPPGSAASWRTGSGDAVGGGLSIVELESKVAELNARLVEPALDEAAKFEDSALFAALDDLVYVYTGSRLPRGMWRRVKPVEVRLSVNLRQLADIYGRLANDPTFSSSSAVLTGENGAEAASDLAAGRRQAGRGMAGYL